MDNTYSLTPDSLRAFNRWHWIIALILLALLLLLPWVAGIGPNSWKACFADMAPAAAAPVTAVPAPAPAPVAAAPAPAPVVTPPPAAKVYFALDTWDLPIDVDRTLADVVAYLREHPDAKALVSGFHDSRGTVARNEELAFNRARQVRAALDKAGISNDRVVMNKPQVTTGTGSNEEARRVEVSVQLP